MNRVIFTICLLALCPVPSALASHIVGISASLNSQVGAETDINLVMTTTNLVAPSSGTPVTTATIYWGDGAVDTSLDVEYQGQTGPGGRAQYAGDFSHIYSDSGAKTITVSAFASNPTYCCYTGYRAGPSPSTTVANTLRLASGGGPPPIPALNLKGALALAGVLLAGGIAVMLRARRA